MFIYINSIRENAAAFRALRNSVGVACEEAGSVASYLRQNSCFESLGAYAHTITGNIVELNSRLGLLAATLDSMASLYESCERVNVLRAEEGGIAHNWSRTKVNHFSEAIVSEVKYRII